MCFLNCVVCRADLRILLRGFQGPRKGNSVGMFILTRQQKPLGGLNPLTPLGSATGVNWVVWTGLYELGCMNWVVWTGLCGLGCMNWVVWTGLYELGCMNWVVWNLYCKLLYELCFVNCFVDSVLWTMLCELCCVSCDTNTKTPYCVNCVVLSCVNCTKTSDLSKTYSEHAQVDSLKWRIPLKRSDKTGRPIRHSANSAMPCAGIDSLVTARCYQAHLGEQSQIAARLPQIGSAYYRPVYGQSYCSGPILSAWVMAWRRLNVFYIQNTVIYHKANWWLQRTHSLQDCPFWCVWSLLVAHILWWAEWVSPKSIVYRPYLYINLYTQT